MDRSESQRGARAIYAAMIDVALGLALEAHDMPDCGERDLIRQQAIRIEQAAESLACRALPV